ncbi:MAG: hypothetical protein CVV08_14250 [Gammaproteobacteria bacterium HGW-Gammaproteobacteria-12]|nr:MAG: hypothetical protein CVV08_14250 [Gammaproteobacteria bacterium HGW-Gammaproteobacteria-12]
MIRALKYLLIILGAALCSVLFIAGAWLLPNIVATDADATYELRGRYKPSPDGKTYLVIEHDNGGGCGTLSVDGKPWPYRLNKAGEIAPGTRTIRCGTEIAIEIKTGNIHYFDYWGP